MIEAAIDKIIAMTKPSIIDVEERIYVDRKIYPVLEPIPTPLVVCTMASIVDYFSSNIDELSKSDLIVHVEAYNRVAMFSNLIAPFEQRKAFITASAMTPEIHFERRMEVESFVIQLQSMFVKTPERDNLLKFLGSLKAGFSKTMTDDGVSQTVTAKTGVTMVSEVEVPNPVTLQPFRTFTEIEQPASDFVFRIHGGQEEPTCALYEADGGAWKLTAIQRVAEWIRKEIPDVAVIA